MDKPKNADFYDCNNFISWAEDNEISLDHIDDWGIWWDCWKTAYICAMNQQ